MTDTEAYKAIMSRAEEIAGMPAIKRRMLKRYADNILHGMKESEAVEEVRNFACQLAIATLFGAQ